MGAGPIVTVIGEADLCLEPNPGFTILPALDMRLVPRAHGFGGVDLCLELNLGLIAPGAKLGMDSIVTIAGEVDRCLEANCGPGASDVAEIDGPTFTTGVIGKEFNEKLALVTGTASGV